MELVLVIPQSFIKGNKTMLFKARIFNIYLKEVLSKKINYGNLFCYCLVTLIFSKSLILGLSQKLSLFLGLIYRYHKYKTDKDYCMAIKHEVFIKQKNTKTTAELKLSKHNSFASSQTNKQQDATQTFYQHQPPLI